MEGKKRLAPARRGVNGIDSMVEKDRNKIVSDTYRLVDVILSVGQQNRFLVLSIGTCAWTESWD